MLLYNVYNWRDPCGFAITQSTYSMTWGSYFDISRWLARRPPLLQTPHVELSIKTNMV